MRDLGPVRITPLVKMLWPDDGSAFSRNAMDNASKNAGDMINALQLKYNRGRQATITSELVDIITGQSCLSYFYESHLNLSHRCQCALSMGGPQNGSWLSVAILEPSIVSKSHVPILI